ncbi:hypothetical protein VF21_04901 [Pseudogymnoascus sp. 05NY08]|nr:hypothetical protein VF21_04901 [Pseudogymnoascus sp. 05NY08]
MSTQELPTKLFINNQYTDSHNKIRHSLRNPTDDSSITDQVHIANAQDVHNAVDAATAAFKTGPWSTFTGAQRAACMLRLADLVEKNVDRLAYLESIPTGRPVSGIIHFDIAHMVQVFRYYAGWADKIEGRTYPQDNGFYKIVRYEPIGVCAGIASWNATFMYIGWKIAPALAAGNCFIFKGSEKSPLGALGIAPLFAEAGFPPGVVQFLTGGPETGALIASHPKISKISFTGSAAGGRKVQEAASKSNLKQVTLELGGKSPAIVFPDAPMELTIGGVGGGFLANSGQICVAASRVLVHASIADDFCASLVKVFEAASKSLGADTLNPETQHGPVVDHAQFKTIMKYIELGKKSAKLLTGGKRIGTKGAFIQPTIFLEPSTDAAIWREEIFGPVLTIKTFETEEEAIELANGTDYGLASCIYTTDITRALRVSSKLQSGGVSINSPFLPELNTPFGGIKQSGYGHELGKDSLISYMNAKSIHINNPRPVSLTSTPEQTPISIAYNAASMAASIYTKRTHLIPAFFPRLPATVLTPTTRLQLAVDEYSMPCGDEPTALTLIFTHGTGFNKRIWEPVIRRLLKAAEDDGGFMVKRVLAVDASNHAESWEVNEGKMRGVGHWPDQSRDILEVLRFFEVKQPVVGIGHSFGGGIMSHAAMMDPSAFCATIFVEPILFVMEKQDKITAAVALRRRDRWDDLKAVQEAFSRSKGFSDWAPEVLAIHAAHGTKEVREGSRSWRTLSTSKEQEAATYIAAPYPRLPDLLAASKQLHFFVLGGESFVYSPSDTQWVQSIERSPGEVVLMRDASHLIPMTHTEELSSILSRFLSKIWELQNSQVADKALL